MAKKKSKGRPPKFVLDENGKEVYGLSYNKSNHMYYATFSDPRVYFTAQYTYGADDFLNSRIKNVVKKYRKWAQRQHLSPEQQKEEEELDKIYNKAKQLFKEGYLDKEVKEYIGQEAKRLLKKGYLSDEEIEKIGIRILERFFIKFGYKISGRRRKPVAMEPVEEELLKYVKYRITDGYYDENIWERAYALIKENPVGFSKKTGIKGIATLNLDQDSPMSLNQAWNIFESYKNSKDLLYDLNEYETVWQALILLIEGKRLHLVNSTALMRAITCDISEISDIEDDLFFERNASRTTSIAGIRKTIHDYKQIPIKHRVEIIYDIFKTVQNADYSQCDHLIDWLSDYLTHK